MFNPFTKLLSVYQQLIIIKIGQEMTDEVAFYDVGSLAE